MNAGPSSLGSPCPGPMSPRGARPRGGPRLPGQPGIRRAGPSLRHLLREASRGCLHGIGGAAPCLPDPELRLENRLATRKTGWRGAAQPRQQLQPGATRPAGTPPLGRRAGPPGWVCARGGVGGDWGHWPAGSPRQVRLRPVEQAPSLGPGQASQSWPRWPLAPGVCWVPALVTSSERTGCLVALAPSGCSGAARAVCSGKTWGGRGGGGALQEPWGPSPQLLPQGSWAGALRGSVLSGVCKAWLGALGRAGALRSGSGAQPRGWGAVSTGVWFCGQLQTR